MWGNDEQDKQLNKLRDQFILDYETKEPEMWEVPEHMKRKMKSPRKKRK